MEKTTLVGEVALYGVAGGKTAAVIGWGTGPAYRTQAVGYGPNHERLLEGLTEALLVGCTALRALVGTGLVAVHYDGRMAVVDVNRPGWVGDLTFSTSAAEAIAAAK